MNTKPIYAVLNPTETSKTMGSVICFTRTEYAQTYADYLNNNRSLVACVIGHLFGVGRKYYVQQLQLCEHPPTMADTGSTEQQ
jgi:hypothetical protein